MRSTEGLEVLVQTIGAKKQRTESKVAARVKQGLGGSGIASGVRLFGVLAVGKVVAVMAYTRWTVWVA